VVVRSILPRSMLVIDLRERSGQPGLSAFSGTATAESARPSLPAAYFLANKARTMSSAMPRSMLSI
jgi:hypothetical protein